MRKTLLPEALTLAVTLAACGGGEETVWIRLVDDFDSEWVQNSPDLPEPERTEWRFDGEGTIELQGAGETMGWEALNDVSGFGVSDGMLVGTAGENGVILGTRADDMDDTDMLYGIEVRMRVSDGSQIGVFTNGAAELTDEARDGRVDAFAGDGRPQLVADLTPGEDVQTYLLREAGAVIRIGAVRNIFIKPTDVDGADFAIESVRIIPLREHLASIPSGPGWQGLAEIYRETIVSRTPERIVVDLDLPARPWLDLAFGTIEDSPVTFEVTVNDEILLRRTVTTPERWTAERFDLTDYAGQSVTLALALEGDDPGLIGYWGHPAVRNSDAMPVNDDITEDRAALLDGGERRPKHVVLFLGDALRSDRLQPWGHDRETSPTLQRLADEGVTFLDNISQASWTKVSVPSILTSLYPTTHGLTDMPDRLPQSVTTMSEAFREAGYATWQSSSVVFSGRLSNLHQGVDVLHEAASLTDMGDYTAKSARPFVDRFLDFAGTHHDVPFFAFVHTFDPHSPFEPRPPYDAMWATDEGRAEHARGNELWEGLMDDLPTQPQIDSTDVDQDLYIQHEFDWYDGSIRGMDEEIERLLEGLEQLDMLDETLFIFIADHGEEFLEHGYHFHGNSAYGDMVNVPLMMWWPGVLPAGVRVEQTTESVDMLPTVLELAGVTPPEEMMGNSLLPLVLDPDATSEFGAIQRAAFSERVMSPTIAGFGLPHDQYSIVLDGWKLVVNENHAEDWPDFELFDHEADPLNLDNVADENPEIVARLSEELTTWREYALSLRPPPDTDAIQGLSEEEIARLRSLGYINN